MIRGCLVAKSIILHYTAAQLLPHRLYMASHFFSKTNFDPITSILSFHPNILNTLCSDSHFI